MGKNNSIFYEYQQLKVVFLLLGFVPILVLFIWGAISQIGFSKFWENNPMSDISLIIIIALLLLVAINMFCIYLKTVVDSDGIHIQIRLFPFYVQSKSFLWENISEVSVKKYNPILRYEGWGMRFGFSGTNLRLGKISLFHKRGINFGFNDTAYTMSGNIGLQLELTNGKKILIGTNKPDELLEVLRKLGKPDNKLHGKGEKK